MRGGCFFFLLVLMGCAGRGSLNGPQATGFRVSLADMAPEIISRNVQSEGWTIQILDRSKRGQTAINTSEEWDQTTVWVVFSAKKADGVAVALSPEQAKPILGNLRSDLRRMITSNGGEIIEVNETETYRERHLIITYRIDRIFGVASARLGPATDQAEECNNRLELSIREQN